MKQLQRFAVLACALVALTTAPASARPLYGFTPFPYDSTDEAVTRTLDIVRNNANVHALHLDDGIPWDELLDAKPNPKRVQREWDDWTRVIPTGRPVYLALAPLAKDRKSLAPTKGEAGTSSSLPWSLKLARLDDDKVKAAYLEYARRAVKQFRPSYLNLGIEAGELAARDPKRWPQFEALYRHVSQALKRDNPRLQIGISFGLQSLMKPGVAELAKPLVDASDYLGLSFYPHMSPFAEKFGDPPLGEREQAWRAPLDWVQRYTNKPIALCETGYSSMNAELPAYSLKIKGDPVLQASYVRELAQLAERDNYLFIVWFLAVDYDRLYERMSGTPDNEVNLLWRNIGLWSGDIKAKPGWAEWQNALAGRIEPLAAKTSTVGSALAPAAITATEIGFSSAKQLFLTGPGGKATLEPDAGMRWTFDYKGTEWAWATRDIGTRLNTTAKRMSLRLRSDRPGPLFVQVELADGQTFFTQIEPRSAWSDFSMDLTQLKADPAKKRDGVLAPERITKLLIADAGAQNKARGQRNVWIARWTFE